MMHDFVRDFETPSQALNSDFSYESVLIFGAICIRQFLKLYERLFNFELLRFISMPVTNATVTFFPSHSRQQPQGADIAVSQVEIFTRKWNLRI